MNWFDTMLSRLNQKKWMIVFSTLIIFMLIIGSITIVIQPFEKEQSRTGSNTLEFEQLTDASISLPISSIQPSQGTRGARSTFGFTLNGTGLPSSGEYNFLAVGDIDKDSNIDIAFGGEDYSGSTTGLYYSLGNGSGNWNTKTITSLYKYGGITIADCDGDTNNELYACYQYKWKSSTGASNGIGAWEWTGSTFSTSGITSPLTSGGCDDLVITNVTGNSGLDMAIATQTSGIKYYEGSGSSSISWTQYSSGLPTSQEYTNIEVSDMNKDGRPDIVAGSYSNTGLEFFTQDSGGTSWTIRSNSFPSATNISTMGVALGDLNNDTHMDIVHGTTNNGMRLLLGNSGGVSKTSFTWTTPTSTNGGLPTSGTSGRYSQIQLADVDLDGDLDILAPKTSSGLRLFLGNGSTNPGNAIAFTEVTGRGLPTTGVYYGSTYLDFDNDGDLDVAGASWGNGIRIYKSNLSDVFDVTPPAGVTDLTPTNVTSNSITVNWTAPADNGTILASGPVQSYDIRYSTLNITMANWGTATQCTGEPTPAAFGTPQGFNITGLQQGTKYYIALRSVDERPNLSILSNIAEETTLGIIDTTLPGKINDLTALNATNNSINLTWTAPADNGSVLSSGKVIEYEIRYNLTAAISNISWPLSPKLTISYSPSSPGSKEEYQVTNLQAVTNYYFAIKARDERPNWGWLSNPTNDTTLPDPDIITPDAIDDLSTTDITETTINLTWTATGDDADLGTASFYDIRYSTATITDLNWGSAIQCSTEPTPQATGNAEYFNISGLLPDTKYYFAIKVGDENPLWSGLSNIANGTTLGSTDSIAPAAINDLAAGQPTPTSITLSWTSIGDDGYTGTVTGYDIRYYTEMITDSLWDISTEFNNPPTPLAAGNQQGCTVDNLLSEQKYYFAIKAFDERPNYSPLSNVPNATTTASDDITPPATINDLTASTLSVNSIKLTWTAPGDDGALGTPTGYDIRYSTSLLNSSNWASANKCENEPTPQAATSAEVFNVTGLFSGTRYYFAIKAFDERPNFSGLSNVPDATTYSSDDTILPATIDDLAVVETTKTTATLTWSAPGDDGTTGTATAYDIRYAESLITALNWNDANIAENVPPPKPAGEIETYLVTGLEQSTTYFFAVRAADERPNWSPVSNSPYGTTLGALVPELQVLLSPEKTIINSSESIIFTVEVQSSLPLQPISGVDIELSSNNPGTVFSSKTGQTDNNGKFFVQLTAPTVSVTTLIEINANVSKAGFKTNRSQITLTVEPKIIDPLKLFNLRITDTDIKLSQTTIRQGDEVNITITINNNGERNSSGFTINIYIDDILYATEPGITGLGIGLDYSTVVSWTPITVGNHTIRVEIIVVEPILESDDTDNSAEITVQVNAKDIPDGQDGGDDTDDKSDDNTGTMTLLLILIIIIVVILIVLFMVFKRKRTQTEPPDMAPTPEHEPEVRVDARIEGEGFKPEVGMVEETLQTSELELEPESESEEFLELEESEPTQPAGEELGGESADDIELEPESEGEDQSEIEKTEAIDWEQTGEETGELEQPETETTPEAQSQETSAQLVPCPTCQNQISVYATPCPHCGTELNW